MPASGSAAALAFSPDQHSVDEIPPLAFETEAEVFAVLDRMRDDLRTRIRVAAGDEEGGKGKGKGKQDLSGDLATVEEVVLKQFFDRVQSIVLSNCTVAGHSYSDYLKLKKKGGLTKTQPFDDTLHQRVLKYQNDLFDAREVNARERVDAPARAAEDVKKLVELDQQQFAQLEAARLVLPDELPLPKPKSSRKSVGAAAAEGPSPVEAQEYFGEGKEAIGKLLQEIPALSTAAAHTAQTALDAASL
ncbi:hypothetical protein JCM21900_004533 [Sporobolomyces salmonicolor]